MGFIEITMKNKFKLLTVSILIKYMYYHDSYKMAGRFVFQVRLNILCCHRLNCEVSLGDIMGTVLMCIFNVD